MGMKKINRSRYTAERKKQSRKKKEMKELTHGRKVKRKKKKALLGSGRNINS